MRGGLSVCAGSGEVLGGDGKGKIIGASKGQWDGALERSYYGYRQQSPLSLCELSVVLSLQDSLFRMLPAGSLYCGL